MSPRGPSARIANEMTETTEPGFRNPNGQVVVRATGLPGTDHLQKIYILSCEKCSREYGANGSDIHLRKCPFCQGGKPGLPIEKDAALGVGLDTEGLRVLQAKFEPTRLERQKEYEEFGAIRAEFIRRFPASAIAGLTLKAYAIGGGEEDNFCYWVERKTRRLGSILGATALKFRVYYDKEEAKYVHQKGYESAEAALGDTKALIGALLSAAKTGDAVSIEDNALAPMFKGKLLSLYYPDRFVPIFADSHLDHFLRHLLLPSSGLSNVAKNQSLGRFKGADQVMARWSPYEFMQFLYFAFGRPSDDGMRESVATELQEHLDFQKDFPAIKTIVPRDITGTIEKPAGVRTFGLTDNTAALGQRASQEELGQRGLQGELIALQFERERLRRAGKPDLVKRIEHTALSRPAAGYDILSFEEDGTLRMIEVKATVAAPSAQTSFFLTRNELETGKKTVGSGGRFFLYRIFSVKSKSPEVFCVPFDELLEAASLEALVYEVAFRLASRPY